MECKNCGNEKISICMNCFSSKEEDRLNTELKETKKELLICASLLAGSILWIEEFMKKDVSRLTDKELEDIVLLAKKLKKYEASCKHIFQN